jgi:arginyl-tRNA synthetase
VTPALLDDLVRAAAREVLVARGLDLGALPADPGVTRARPEHGEYATAVALRTAGRIGVPPRELAGWLADALAGRPELAGAEVAGPGFLNLRTTAAVRGALVAEVLAAGDDYGTGPGAAEVEEAADRLGRAAGGELVAAVGPDAARYAALRPIADIELLTRRIPENPLFRLQYAHARLAGLARGAAALGVRLGADVGPLSHPCESRLVGEVADFPAVVRTGEPQRVAGYLEGLAGAFFDFHDACPVLPTGDEEVTDLHRARLATVVAAHRVLVNGLGLLGVSAPERI